MRLSLILLCLGSSAQAANTASHQHVRSFGADRSLDVTNMETAEDRTIGRILKTKIEEEKENDDEDSEEERGLPKFPSMAKLKALRTVERLKEMQEALTIAKVHVKTAADAAKAAVKAKKVTAMVTELDDTTKVEKILKDSSLKNDIFKGWHEENIHPQIVFDALAASGKYSTRNWDEIAVSYLDYSLEMALSTVKTK